MRSMGCRSLALIEVEQLAGQYDDRQAHRDAPLDPVESGLTRDLDGDSDECDQDRHVWREDRPHWRGHRVGAGEVDPGLGYEGSGGDRGGGGETPGVG